MGRSAEMWFDAQEQQQEVEQSQAEFDAEVTAEQYVAVRVNSTDDLFNLMVQMNRVRAEELK
jgi:hypothetical protein